MRGVSCHSGSARCGDGLPRQGARAGTGEALRAEAWTLQDIAAELGVAKSSVSLWVRDVEFEPRPRRTGRRRAPNKLQVAKADEIERLRREGREQIGSLSEREFLVAGLALYAGEGAKGDGHVSFANSDPRMIGMFTTWLRRFFDVDEGRLRMKVYLHADQDLEVAEAFWSELTGIPRSQFNRAYRPEPRYGYRSAKHPMGCPSVRYSCSTTHRTVMGLIEALLDSEIFDPG